MIDNIVADSSQLSVLAKVLEEHCSANGLTSALDRETVAQRLIVMFGQGIESESELIAGLDVPHLAAA